MTNYDQWKTTEPALECSDCGESHGARCEWAEHCRQCSRDGEQMAEPRICVDCAEENEQAARRHDWLASRDYI